MAERPAHGARSQAATRAAQAPEAPPRVRPARNASYVAAANIGAKALGFVLFFYAASALGPGLFGTYTRIIQFVGLFEILTDLGLNGLVVRDVARDPDLATRYVSNVLAIRVLLSIVAVALIVALTPTPVYDIAPQWRLATYIYALYLVPLAAGNVLQAVFQFSERLSYNAVYNVAMNGARVALSVLALLLGHNILALMVVATAVTIVSVVATAWVIYTRFLPRRLDLRPTWWPALLWRAVPFAMLTILNVLYTRADTQILGALECAGKTTCIQVGLYGAASRGLDILVVVFVGGIQAVTLPLFSRTAHESRADLTRLVQSATTLMLVLGVPVAIFISFYAREAMDLLRDSEYILAAPALAVIVWGFPCILVVNILYMALYAVDKQSVVTAAFAANLVFNVGLNIVFIPRYSYMASAVLTVASEVLNGVIVLVALRRAIGPLGLAPTALKVSLVGLVTAATLWLTHGIGPFDGIFAGVPLGVVALVVSLRLTRVLGATERDILSSVPFIGRYAWLV